MIRWLIVGAGAVGRVHYSAIGRLGVAEVSGIVTPNETTGFDVPVFKELSRALETTSPNAVIIATPNDTHRPIIEEVLDTQLPVLCEKPVGATTADAVWATRQSTSKNVPIGVVLNQRFCSHNIWVRNLIASQRFDVSRVSFRLALPELSGWHGDPIRSGGLLRLIGVHYLDLIAWWLGQPEISEATVRDGTGSGLANLKLRFPNGSTGTLTLSASDDNRPGPHHWIIEGTQGRIEIVGDEIALSGGFPDVPESPVRHSDQWFGPGHMALLAACSKQLGTDGDFSIPVKEVIPTLELIDKARALVSS